MHNKYFQEVHKRHIENFQCNQNVYVLSVCLNCGVVSTPVLSVLHKFFFPLNMKLNFSIKVLFHSVLNIVFLQVDLVNLRAYYCIFGENAISCIVSFIFICMIVYFQIILK